MASAAVKTVEAASVGAARIVKGVVLLPLVLLQNIATLGILMFLAIGLIGNRAILLEISPDIAKHAKGLATVLNVMFDFLQVAVKIIVDVVSVIIDVIRKLMGKHHNSLPHRKINTHVLSADEIHDFFNNLPPRCAPYDSSIYIMRGGLKYLLSPITCPIIRASYPVPWLWDTMNALIGWTADDATPIGVPIIDGSPGNCMAKEHNDWLCSALGVGFLIGEILLPIFLLFIVWPYIFDPIIKMAWQATQNAVATATSAVLWIIELIDKKIREL